MSILNSAEHRVYIIEPDQSIRREITSVVHGLFPEKSPSVFEIDSIDSIPESSDSIIVIMDVNMPDELGNLAARSVWQRNSRAKIVFWSYSHRLAYLNEIRRIVPSSTIFAYLLKTDGPNALAFAIASVAIHNNTYVSASCRENQSGALTCSLLTRIDYETLLDVSFGLTDKAISQRRNISVRGVQNRLTSLLQKLGCDPTEQPITSDGAEFFNSRTRLVYEAFGASYITRHDIAYHKQYFERWIKNVSVPVLPKSQRQRQARLDKAEAALPVEISPGVAAAM